MTGSDFDDLSQRHFRAMLMARRLEDRLRSLYFRGEIAGGAYLGKGQEALSAAHGILLRDGDIFAPAIRDMGGRIARGEDPLNVLRVNMGRRTGSMRGRDGNVHRACPELGILAMISHLGAMVATVGGMLLARRLRGELKGSDLPVGLCSLGDGAMGTGAAHEGINLVAVEKLPVVIMVANNQLAYSTTNDRSFACRDLVTRAEGYGVRGHQCDGEDPEACLQVAQTAIAAARAGDGPQLVVARLLRLTGHGEHDDATYTPKELLATARDCVEVGTEQQRRRGLDIEALQQEIDQQIDTAVAQALADPEPDPEEEDWCAYSERWLHQGLVP